LCGRARTLERRLEAGLVVDEGLVGQRAVPAAPAGVR